MVELTPEFVKGIHKLGGSFLGVSDQIIEVRTIINALKQNKINQLYVIGDLKDHRMIQNLYQEITDQGLEINVAGVAKSVEKHFPLSDNQFGFETQIQVIELYRNP